MHNTPSGEQVQHDGSEVVAREHYQGRAFTSPLRGKVAVVTGAARGIGRCICADFAANGADVIAIDAAKVVSDTTAYVPASPEDLEETGAIVRAHGRRFASFQVDMRDREGLKDVAEEAVGQMGKLDIVVGNAAIQVFKPLLEMEDRHWDDVIDINLTGSANLIRIFAPYLVRNGRGRIILVSSMQGRYGTKNGSSYSASKWGMIGLMKSAALELGTHKITVNTIEPGLIDTALTHNDKRWSAAVGETMTTPPPEHPTEGETIKAREPKSPLGVPWLQPEQVSPVAVFLASDAAEMVTGACWDVNAGDSAHNLG